MISTEYIQTGEKGPQIIKHKTHSTRHCLKGMLKRAVGSQGKDEPSNSRNTTKPPRISSVQVLLQSDAEKEATHKINRKPVPSSQPPLSSSRASSGPSPYQSLLKSYPEFHDLLDVNNWPSLPAPTNLSRTLEPPTNNLWQTPQQLSLMIHHWINSSPNNSALPPSEFEHACPIAYHYIRGIMTGDGINDWVTRTAVLKELDRANAMMLEVGGGGEGGMCRL